MRVVCGRTLRSASCHVERSRNIFALRAQGGHGMPCPYGGCLRYVFLYPAPFNPPYGGGLGRGFFSSISLSHQFLYRAAQLVGARCGLAVAANALEACNHVLILHTCCQLAYSLQVTVATAVELHFFQYSVLARYLNVSRTCSVCGVCYCFHGFGLIFNLPPLRSSLFAKEGQLICFCFRTPPLWEEEGDRLRWRRWFSIRGFSISLRFARPSLRKRDS